MRKGKICSKFKKILITIMCAITVVFSMPIKAKADLIPDFINLLLRIPDAIMWLGNRYIVGTDAATNIKLDFKGWGGQGRIYNFGISPYNIFTSGTESEVLYTWRPQGNEYDELANLLLNEQASILDAYEPTEYQGQKVYMVRGVNINNNFFDNYFDDKGKYDPNSSHDNLPGFYNGDTGFGYFSEDTLYLREDIVNKVSNGNSTALKAVRLGLFDVNFFRGYKVVDENAQLVSSNILSAAVGNIYKNLRNLCIVLMMLVLLYIGIRIIISTAASDQSKYKKMLMDWLIGLCLLFVMHYIMSFVMNINTVIVNMLKNDEGDSYYISIAELQDDNADDSGQGNKDSSWLDLALGNSPDGVTDSFGAQEFFKKKVIIEATNDDQVGFNINTDGVVDITQSDCIMYKNVQKADIDFSKWGNNGKMQLSAGLVNSTNDNEKYAGKAIYKANLMEFARTLSSFAADNAKNVIIYSNGKSHEIEAHDNSDEDGYWGQLAYSILYLTLVIETVMFIVIYMKRVLQLAMLTMIAPLVSFMYPLDKVGDGQAQAYNGWLKDYIFNVLIQPLHLLLYSIFIGAASELFSKNVIYALAVYAFMIPAEKYFKKIFGFDKASGSPPGAFAGAFGGGLAMRGFDKLAGLGPHSKGKGGSSGDKDRKGIKIKKDKPQPSSGGDSTSLGTSSILKGASGSKSPKSSGDASGNGYGGSKGTNGLSGSDSLGATGGSGSPSPTAGLNKKGGRIGNLAKAGRGMLGRGITRAITGGKYDSLKGLSKTAQFSAIGGAMAKRGANIAGRYIGTKALGAAGLLAGTATAIATGDASNISKGLGTGIVTGFSRGGQFADWGSNKIGGIINDTSAELANVDEGYRAKYRADQAIAKLAPEDRTEARIATIEKYARFTDIEDKDTVDALMKADELAEHDEYNAMALYDDAKDYGDLRIESNRDAYIRRELSKEMEKVNVSEEEANALYAERQAADLKQVDEQKKIAEKQYKEQLKAKEAAVKEQEQAIKDEYERKIKEQNNAEARKKLEKDREKELFDLRQKGNDERRKLIEAHNLEVAQFESQKADIRNKPMDTDFMNSIRESKARSSTDRKIKQIIDVQRPMKI